MANMSYCRFENTYRDLRDCYYALEDRGPEELSDSELNHARHMMKICENILNYSEQVNDEVEFRASEVNEN